MCDQKEAPSGSSCFSERTKVEPTQKLATGEGCTGRIFLLNLLGNPATSRKHEGDYREVKVVAATTLKKCSEIQGSRYCCPSK